MNALELVAKKRIERSRQALRLRWGCFECLILLLGIVSFASILVSAWIFVQSEGLFREGYGLRIRKASVTSSLHTSLPDMIDSIKSRTVIYKDLPHTCGMDWITAAASSIHHVEADFIIVPALCQEDTVKEVLEILNIMESDGTIAGVKIVWVLPESLQTVPDIDSLIGREKSAIHVIFPHEFRKVELETHPDILKSLSQSEKLSFSIGFKRQFN